MYNNKPIFYLSTELMNKYFFKDRSIFTQEHEYGGEIFFNYDKQKKRYKAHRIAFTKGNGCHVDIPMALINFHTHPIKCYLEQEAIWGWPSGGDMRSIVEFKHENLCHCVFTLEGTYIIKVNSKVKNNLNQRQLNTIQYNFTSTHKYRSFENYNKHHLYFKREFLIIRDLPFKNTLRLWLAYANRYSVVINHKSEPVFRVKFIPNNTFQNDKRLLITYNIFKILNNKNINKYIKFKGDLIVQNCC